MHLERQTFLVKDTVLFKKFAAAILFLSLAGFASISTAAPKCTQVFGKATSSDRAGALFLHERDPKLHTTAPVEKQVLIEKRSSGSTLQKPADKLNLWLQNLNALSEKSAKSIWTRDQVKASLQKMYVMKPNEVPETYYQLQAKIARDRGYGNVEYSPKQKAQLAKTVIEDQKHSLDTWTNFLISPGLKMYPMWTKYWIFTGMTKLSKFNPEDGTFANRSKETVAPYPELNQEALGMVMEMVLKRVDKKSLEEIKDPQLLQLIQSANFGKMYGHALKTLGGQEAGQFKSNEGAWKVFPQGSNANSLVRSLKGQNTGWCTANAATAKSQLADGDFHVYYSLDDNGKPTRPRLAIRMEGDQIGEIRGVGADQNFDVQISKTNVLSEKLKEFGEKGNAFKEKDRDMRLLTDLERKDKMGLPLTKEEIRFLYEIDRNISGFGHNRDPRINELWAKRDAKADLIALWDNKYTRDEISFSTAEFLEKKSKVHIGNLDLTELTSTTSLSLPDFVSGNVDLWNLTSAKGLKLPDTINGNLNLWSLTSAEGVTFPTTVSGNFALWNVTSVKGLKLPKTINGAIDLRNLTSPEGLSLPETVGGELNLAALPSIDGVILPQKINGHLDLRSLESAGTMKLPETINGMVILSGLKSAKGLKLPDGFEMDNYFGPTDF